MHRPNILILTTPTPSPSMAAQPDGGMARAASLVRHWRLLLLFTLELLACAIHPLYGPTPPPPRHRTSEHRQHRMPSPGLAGAHVRPALVYPAHSLAAPAGAGRAKRASGPKRTEPVGPRQLAGLARARPARPAADRPASARADISRARDRGAPHAPFMARDRGGATFPAP
jgi:hypothetical protein